MNKEQVDVLPDYSAELASLGRGSMMVRIAKLEAALNLARYTLSKIHEHGDNGDAERAEEEIAQILKGKG